MDGEDLVEVEVEAVELVLGAIVFAPGVSLGTVFGVHQPATSITTLFQLQIIN